MKAAEFGIKHKVTGLFFGGFDKDNTPLWVPESSAKRMDASSAKGQALLFASFDIPAQKKPVNI